MKIFLTATWEKFIQQIPDIASPQKGKHLTDSSPHPSSDKEASGSQAKPVPNGWFNSYYIGPTDDATMKALPDPLHAADYIAQQHDLEYQALGLNGISGTLDPKSKEADYRLIERCNELIGLYEKGVKAYHGYQITPLAYQAAHYMREYFLVEEGLSNFIKKNIKDLPNLF